MPLKLVSHNVKDKKVKFARISDEFLFMGSQNGVQNFFILAMTLRIIGILKSINQFYDR